jgi:hypothetical protein
MGGQERRQRQGNVDEHDPPPAEELSDDAAADHAHDEP